MLQNIEEQIILFGNLGFVAYVTPSIFDLVFSIEDALVEREKFQRIKSSAV